MSRFARSAAIGRRSAGRALAVAAATALSLTGSVASAQQPSPPPAKKAPAAAPAAKAAPAAAAGPPQSAWVKLCEKAAFVAKTKDGKEEKQEKSICLTHHERLDRDTGMVMVSAAIRQIEGGDKEHLMVMVPLGMNIAAGIRAVVYPKDVWDKAQKNEKVDDSKLKPQKLIYTICHPAGCTAEMESTKEMVAEMKAAGGMMVFAVNAGGQVIAFPVPATGFGATYDGKPVDSEEYSKARRALMEQIRARQQELMAQYQKDQEEKAKGGGAPTAPAPPAAAPAQKAPAQKK